MRVVKLWVVRGEMDPVGGEFDEKECLVIEEQIADTFSLCDLKRVVELEGGDFHMHILLYNTNSAQRRLGQPGVPTCVSFKTGVVMGHPCRAAWG